MLGSSLEIASPPNPATTVDPIHDLLPPQEYILAFVVPALIIVGMLLLAIIIKRAMLINTLQNIINLGLCKMK